MKSSWLRGLVALLMLACAGAQPVGGDALLSAALTLALHGEHHAHSVSVVEDDGHLHLVLAHDERGHEHGRVPHEEDGTISFSEGDHVFHLPGDAAASTAFRRAALDPVPPALAVAVAIQFARAPLWLPRVSPEPRARSSDHLKTVVLRL